MAARVSSTIGKHVSPVADDFTYYIEDQPPEARNRYRSKLTYDRGTKSLPDPYKISAKWQQDMSTWPDLTYGDIYNYLIDSPGVYSKEALKAYKSLDAYRFVQSGHVQEVHYLDVADSPFCFLKSKVIPSQRINDKPHLPWICVTKETGIIYCAHCTCMAGLGEVCSHIAAVLFKVQIAVQLGLTTKSSTSQICQWNSTFRKEIEPKTISEMQCILKSGNRKNPVETVHATGKDDLPTSDIIKELYKVCPNATFFTTIPPVEPISDDSQRKQVATERAPSTLTSLSNTEYGELSSEGLTEVCNNVWTDYSVSPEQASYIEGVTRDQSVCERWYEHRKGRITASKAHDVFVLRNTSSPTNLIKGIMNYNSYDLSKLKAVRWGLDSEDTAREKYSQAIGAFHQSFTVRQCGLLIDTRNPYLGASADGLRTCKCCGNGTIEIKCPYKHRKNKIASAAKSDKSFCLGSDLKLKTSHKYYTQVQVQMHVHKVLFCDFIVYTECDMIVNVIPYDSEFCSRVLNKCENFFKSCVLPEILTGKLSSEAIEPASLKDPELLYCICQEPAYGMMIQCSKLSDCPMEWFHYKCVNIKRKPRGKWLCPNCK